MMAGLFLLFLITMLLAWSGFRQISIYLFIITLILGTALFLHHATSALNINL